VIRFLGRDLADAEATLRLWLKADPSPEVVARRRLWVPFYNARARALRDGLPVMSHDEYLTLLQRADGKCEVTGITFGYRRPAGARTAPWAPSIDRIESGRGYDFTNCRLVCVAVNFALNEFGEAVLRRIARHITNRKTSP
jgi:hypothetical protein